MGTEEEIYQRRMQQKQESPLSVQASKGLRDSSGDAVDAIYENRLLDNARPEITVNKFTEERMRNGMMEATEMSILEKSMDYLSRGNYVAAEAAMSLLEGEGFEGLWQATKAGATGEKPTSFIDVMDEVLPGRNPWVNIPVGFAGDVILDPINLIPWTWPSKVGHLLGLPKLLRAADNITHVSKMVKTTKNVVGDLPGINWMGKAFKPGFSLRKHEGAYDLYRNVELKIASIKRNVREELEHRLDLFRGATKRVGVDADWAMAEMIRGHEAGELTMEAEKLGPQLRELFRIDETMQDPEAMGILKDTYGSVVRGLEKMKKDEVAAGILNPKKIIDNYFPHIFEKGTIKQMPGGKWKVEGRYGFFTSLKYRGAPFFQKPREFDSIESAKNWLASKAVTGHTIPVPVEHWLRGYAIRRFVGESALAWKGFVDDALEGFGTPLEGMFEAAAKEAGYKNFTQALKAKESGFDQLWGIVQTKIPKGYRLVMPTTALRSPSARNLSEKMLKESLGDVPTELEKIFAQEGPNFLYHLFKNTKGKGLSVDVGDDIIKALSAKNVFLMPTEVADHIKESFKIFSTDEQVRGFLGAVDGAMHIWKSMATSMRLPFHQRNAISNTWLMYLGGVKAPMMPQRIAQAGLIQAKSKKFKFQGFDGEELNEIANRYGVRAFGWIAADVPRMFQKELFISTERGKLARKMGVGVNAGNPFETWSRAGRKYGTQVEDNARLALFLNRIKEMGITSANATDKGLYEAANHVKKHLFDYTELTPFERTVMKRIFPFYTWMRKNIPLQLESIVTHPEKFARLADVERDLYPLFTEPETKQEKAIRPQWLDEMRAMKMKEWETEDGTPIYTWIDLPVSDLHKVQKLGKFLSSSVNPGLVLFDTIRNVRTWPRAGVAGQPGQKIPAPFYIQFLPQKDWKVMGIEPVRHKKTGKVVLGIDPQWKYALNTMFPFLNDWEAMHPGGVNLGIRREGEAFPRFMSYVTGIKFKPMHKQDLALQKYYKTIDFQKNIRRAGKTQVELTPVEIREIYRETME